MTDRLVVTAAGALALVSACSAGASRPGHAAIPPAPRATLHGKIAYSTRGGDTWVMNANGGGRRRITRSAAGSNSTPTSRRTDGGSSSAPPADATHRHERVGLLFPAWSPNGKKIAFSGLPHGGGTLDTIHVMNPDGSAVVDLGPPGECATWSPDSSKIMYCSHHGDGNWAVCVMNATAATRQLTHPKLIWREQRLDLKPGPRERSRDSRLEPTQRS